MSPAEQPAPVVTKAQLQHCSEALEYFDSSRMSWLDADSTPNRKLQKTIDTERRRLRTFTRLLDDEARLTGNYDNRSRRIRNGPVPAILLDPLLPKLGPEQRTDRLREILAATEQPTALHYYSKPLIALLGCGLPFLATSLTVLPPWVLLLPLLLIAALLVPSKDRVHVRISDQGGPVVVSPGRWANIDLEDASLLATHTSHIGWDPTPISSGRTVRDHGLLDEPDDPNEIASHLPYPALASAAAPRSDPDSASPQQDAMPNRATDFRRTSAADVRKARTDLLDAWGAYSLDREARYLTKPLLHDITGTVTTTVAYQNALQDLIAAVDELTDDSPQHRIDAAAVLADAAWNAWHDANDYAAEVGLGDRTPTERANLRQLGNLVERLTHSTASDPELPTIKRAIQACLDKISTVSVSWQDIAALPAIEAAGVLPQLTAGRQP